MSEMEQAPEVPKRSADSQPTHVPEIIFFKDVFKGDSWRTVFNSSWVGDDWNDRISSCVVVSGSWTLYQHRDYGGESVTIGLGYKDFTGTEWDNRISSFAADDW